MKTPAIVFTDIGKVELMEVDMPEPQPNEVQIRTEMSFLSGGTERWVLRRAFTWSLTPCPSIPGYQRVGIVMKLGSGVSCFQFGERVMATVGVWSTSVVPFWGSHIGTVNTLNS